MQCLPRVERKIGRADELKAAGDLGKIMSAQLDADAFAERQLPDGGDFAIKISARIRRVQDRARAIGEQELALVFHREGRRLDQARRTTQSPGGFVRKTKGTLRFEDLDDWEQDKIKCGAKHFAALAKSDAEEIVGASLLATLHVLSREQARSHWQSTAHSGRFTLGWVPIALFGLGLPAGGYEWAVSAAKV